MAHPLQAKLRDAIRSRDDQIAKIQQLELQHHDRDAAFQSARTAEEAAKTHAASLAEAFVAGDAAEADLDAARAALPALADASDRADELLRATYAQIGKAEAELTTRNVAIAAVATPLAVIACDQREAKCYALLREFADVMVQRHVLALGCSVWETAARGQRMEPIAVSNPSCGMLRRRDPGGLWDDGLVDLLRKHGLQPNFSPVGGLNGFPPEVLVSMDIAYEPPPDEAA